MKARAPRAMLDCRGVVYIEFILAFVPVFTLFLGTVQLGLLSVAQLVVRHAAVTAVRSAAVVLEDDPRYYGGAPRGDISGTQSNHDGERRLARRLGAGGHAAQPIFSLGGPRLAAIRRAAHVPLAAIAPDPKLVALSAMPVGPQSVERALGSTRADRIAFALAVYAPMTTAVTFPRSPGGRELFQDQLPAQAQVTVRVTQIVLCAVPIAAQLMCKRLGDRNGLDPARKRALRELELAPGHAFHYLLGASRVMLLQGEATLPAQRAPYRYAGEARGERS